jgi:hypothetical protein
MAETHGAPRPAPLSSAAHIPRLQEARMAVLGVVLIVIGIAFLLLGLAGAAREVFKKAAPQPGQRGILSSIDPEKWAKLVGALNETIKLAGTWIAIVLVGGALVGVGAYLLGQ